jgi:hypothetical protein
VSVCGCLRRYSAVLFLILGMQMLHLLESTILRALPTDSTIESKLIYYLPIYCILLMWCLCDSIFMEGRGRKTKTPSL